MLQRILLLTTAGLLAGCSTIDREWDMPMGRAYRPANFATSGAIPEGVRRVGVLPLHSEQWTAAELASIEGAFASELGKFERFEVVAVSRADLERRFGSASFMSSAAIPADFLGRLRHDFGLDAVLFLDLTHFAPYQPIAMGVRGKLVAAGDGGIFWSFDSVFDSAQPEVAVAARRYHQGMSRPAYPLENTSGILQSPARYAKYVAHAVFETLPLREAPRRN